MINHDFSLSTAASLGRRPLALIAAIASSAAVPTLALILLSLALGAEPQGLFTAELSHPYAAFSVVCYAASLVLVALLGLPAHAILTAIKALRPWPFMLSGLGLGIVAGYPLARLITSAVLFFPSGSVPFIGVEIVVCFFSAIIASISALVFLFAWKAATRSA